MYWLTKKINKPLAYIMILAMVFTLVLPAHTWAEPLQQITDIALADTSAVVDGDVGIIGGNATSYVGISSGEEDTKETELIPDENNTQTEPDQSDQSDQVEQQATENKETNIDNTAKDNTKDTKDEPTESEQAQNNHQQQNSPETSGAIIEQSAGKLNNNTKEASSPVMPTSTNEVDKSELAAKIEQANKLRGADYTGDSWADLTQALVDIIEGETTLFATIKKALDQEKVPYTVYSGLIETIAAEGDWQWMINGSGGMLVPETSLKNGDEIVLVLGNIWDPTITRLKLSSNKVQANDQFTVTLEKIEEGKWLPVAGQTIVFASMEKTTDDKGQVILTAQKEGTQDISAQTKDNLIRPVPVQITVTKKDSGGGTPTPTPTKTVTVSVEKRSIGEGDIYSPTQVELQDGDTAFTIIYRLLGSKVEHRGSKSSLYVGAIDNLAEFDRGPGSGWMYSVNGWFPNYSAGIYDLKDGDVLRWQYTTNLGEDIGGDGAINPATDEEIAALKNAIINAKKLDKNQYTADSWAVFQQKLAMAEEVSQLKPPGKSRLNRALNALQQAIDNLEKKPSEPGQPEEPTNPVEEIIVDETNKQIEITGDTPKNITIPKNVTDVSINLANLLNKPENGTITSQPLPELNIAADVAQGAAPVQMVMPAGTTVSAAASTNWNGTIGLPKPVAPETITVAPDTGKKAQVNAAIEVGISNILLSFSQPVKIVFPGAAGKHVGFIQGEKFTPITYIIKATNAAAVNQELTSQGVLEGKQDVGQDLVIWTKHFTKFVAYSQEPIEEQPTDIETAIQGAINWIKSGDIEYPWEWNALGIARAGQTVPDGYHTHIEQYLAEKEGKFRKVTDYERIALAVTAIGKDPKNVAGYNLLENIYNSERMTNQGTNGPVFALIALDSADYQVPANAKWNRDQLVDWILQQQETDGGFPLKKGETSSDIDITAMTLQALSNYQQRDDVQKATQKAINYLSTNQLAHGGYRAWNTDNSESVAQTIIALTALGINPESDQRFVKANGNLVSRLLQFIQEDGGFLHEWGSNLGSNDMATEQGLMALVAYDRFLKGSNKLYDMQDVQDEPTPVVDKTQLAAKIAAAEKLVAADYTAESWAKLATALQSAKAVMADQKATQAAVNQALTDLNSGINGLVLKDKPTPNATVTVRVEGATKTLLPLTKVDIIENQTTLLAAVQKALDSQKVPYQMDGQLIDTIAGESDWQWLVDGSGGMYLPGTPLKGGHEILLVRGDIWDPVITKLMVSDDKVKVGAKITVTLQKIAAGQTLPVPNQIVTFGTEQKTTDDKGQVVFSADKEGTYQINALTKDNFIRPVPVSVSVTRASSGGGGGGGGTTTDGTSQFVRAAQGGSLTYQDAKVIIPAGALPGDATIKLIKLSATAADQIAAQHQQAQLIGDIYEVTTTGNRQLGQKTMTVKVAYDPTKVKAEDALQMMYWDDSKKQWNTLTSKTETGTGGKNYVVADVNVFTKLALFGQHSQSSESETAQPTQQPKQEQLPQPVPATAQTIILNIHQATAMVNGTQQQLDAPPAIDAKAHRVLVPLRFVSEALGVQVDWDSNKRQVVVQGDGQTIILTLNSTSVSVNGQTQTIDSAPDVAPPGRILVPLRFVSETLGASVDYDADSKQVVIKK